MVDSVRKVESTSNPDGQSPESQSIVAADVVGANAVFVAVADAVVGYDCYLRLSGQE